MKATYSDLVQDNLNTVPDRSSFDIRRQDTNCQRYSQLRQLKQMNSNTREAKLAVNCLPSRQ